MTAFVVVALVSGGIAMRGLMQASAAEQRAAHFADAQQLETLHQEFAGLLPIRDPQRARAWLDAARALLARLPEHRHRLAELRARALPLEEEDRQRQVRAHPKFERLERLRAIDRSVEARHGMASAIAFEADPEQSSARRQEIQELERLVQAQPLSEFADPDDQVLHDALARLVDGLVAFGQRDDIPGIVHRALARSREEPAATWDEMLASIAAMDCYRDLQMDEPLAGLAPLRLDPHSGFWELYLVASGDRPRAAADGRLVIEEASALVFVLLPGAVFTLGSSDDPTHPRFDPLLRPMENHLVEVQLEPFLLSKFELTQAQWMRLSDGPNPSFYSPGVNGWCDAVTLCNPVESASWDDAHAVLLRHGLTLPTEAQWEYAARGNTDGVFWTNGDAASLQGCENLRDRTADEAGFEENEKDPMPWHDGFIVHAPVGSFAPNPFGLHDVLGNVSEWCLDRGPANVSENVLAAGTGEILLLDGRNRAYRGGAFGRDHEWAHAGKRGVANGRDAYFGVRPALRLR